MSCTQYHEAISAFLDNELTPGQRAELERHLVACPVCAERLKSFRRLKSAIGRLEGRASLPPGVQARIEALRFHVPPPRRRYRRVIGVAVASAALIGLILGRLGLRSETSLPLYRELVADHLRYVPEAMPAEVASADRDEIRRFFRDQVPFEPVVPVLKSAHLLGGRVCNIAGRKTQLLFYARKDHKFSLYVSDQPLTAHTCDSAKDHHVCGYRHGHLSLTLVGDASQEELLTLLQSAAF
jgi:anti-sigma factor RsiW